MIKNENYITINGFMINELNLKGNELIVYAIIYGFSQTDGQYYTGSLNYLASWTNSTKQGVLKNLKSLLDKGLIIKEEVFNNGVKFVKYRITKFNTLLNKVEYPIKQSLPNNIEDNINNNIDNKEKKKKNKETNNKELEKLVSEYTTNKDLIDTLKDFIAMRKEIKKPITPTGLKRMLTKLDKLATNELEKIEILANSITHNWQDIYQLKNSFKTSDVYSVNNIKQDGKNDKINIDNYIEI